MKEHPEQKLLLTGHTDRSGDAGYNLELSKRRAENILHILRGNKEAWARHNEPTTHHKVEDYQQLLKWLHEEHGFDTDPGEIDNKLGPATKAAVKRFQIAYNQEFNKSIAEDSVVGRETWGAFFDIYTRELRKILKVDEAGLSAMQQSLRFLNNPESVGCGENFPKTALNRSRTDRRVELFFFDPGEEPTVPLRCHPSVGKCIKDACEIRNDKLYKLEPIPVKPLPIPLDAVAALISFPEAEQAPAPAASRSALANTPTAPAANAPAIAPATKAVVVKKPHAKAARVDVDLKTDKPFDGIGTFTVSPNDKIHFFLGEKKIEFNGKDNVFTGAELEFGVTLFAEGVTASSSMDDVTLTLTLSGGSKKAGSPGTAKMTAVEVTLDICEPISDVTKPPQPLAQPPATTPPKGAKPKDKVFGGRAVPVQDEGKTSERAILFVRQVKPSSFNGKLVLTALSEKVRAFVEGTPSKDERALPKRHVFPASDVAAKDLRFFAEGAALSSKVRDTGFQLGIEGLQEDADHVTMTVVHAEIVSNVEPKDVKTVAIVKEKPERKTKSKFFPAPIIIGVNYDVQLRPHTEMPAPDGPFDPPKFQWSSSAPAAQLQLTDLGKEVVKLKAKKISSGQDDIRIDLIVDSDAGKFKKSHRLTIVNVEIDPVISGDTLTVTSDINFIRNPAVTPILRGAAASDTKQAAKIEITKIEPTTLNWTDDDPRIAWWIIGGELPEAGKAKYEAKADFLNDEKAKRGTKIQVVGVESKNPGDVLIQPYSGGFAYGMFRSHVAELKQIKYRVNRIFTNAVPPSPGKAAIPPRVPTRTHADAKQHIKATNIYLRQLGLELIPDDSAEMASSAGNPKVGLANLDASVVAVTRIENGHFDVQVNKQSLTFRALDSGGDRAVRINARNEIIVFAYIHSLAAGNTVLAQAQLWPHNHAPKERKDPPLPTSHVLEDKGVPSSSLITKTGIPGSTPVSKVRISVLRALFTNFKSSTTNRHVDLLWGIAVPTLSIDNFASGGAAGTNSNMIYGATLAHELGHVLGLNHRIAGGDPFADGLTRPKEKNVMFPSLNITPTDITNKKNAENFDIIQAKVVRFSEVLFRNP